MSLEPRERAAGYLATLVVALILAGCLVGATHLLGH
jgi:hypothetical protein